MKNFYLPSDIAEIGSRLEPIYDLLSGKTIVLTGAGGFLGRYFVETFRYLNENHLDRPIKTIALDNFITLDKAPAAPTDDPNLTFMVHDVIQLFAIDEPVDYVMHAAGIASPFYYRAFPLETMEVAITGTKNMLNMAQEKSARFTFFSSSEIYGDPDPKHVPMQESYRGNVASQGPRACYDESKRVGETLCYVFHEVKGTATNVIRPFNVYGPGMMEADYRVLPNFAGRIKAGIPLNVYGSGHQTRTFCYITDAIVGFLLVMAKGVPGATYNIGNPRPEISMLELVSLIEDVMGKSLDKHIIEYPDSYPADEPQRRCPDIQKARTQLKFDPVIEIRDGLENFLTWADGVYQGKA